MTGTVPVIQQYTFSPEENKVQLPQSLSSVSIFSYSYSQPESKLLRIMWRFFSSIAHPHANSHSILLVPFPIEHSKTSPFHFHYHISHLRLPTDFLTACSILICSFATLYFFKNGWNDPKCKFQVLHPYLIWIITGLWHCFQILASVSLPIIVYL